MLGHGRADGILRRSRQKCSAQSKVCDPKGYILAGNGDIALKRRSLRPNRRVRDLEKLRDYLYSHMLWIKAKRSHSSPRGRGLFEKDILFKTSECVGVAQIAEVTKRVGIEDLGAGNLADGPGQFRD